MSSQKDSLLDIVLSNLIRFYIPLPVQININSVIYWLLVYSTSNESWYCNIISTGYLPWKNSHSFHIFVFHERRIHLFEFSSTAQSVNDLSNEYISTTRGNIPENGSQCPICRSEMNPLSGAKCSTYVPVFLFFTIKKTENVCIPCSKQVRRSLVQQGTPEYTTAELISKTWDEIDTDPEFL